jgi:hypothetical protein
MNDPTVAAINRELTDLDAGARRLAGLLEAADAYTRAEALLLLRAVNEALGDTADRLEGLAAGGPAAAPTVAQDAAGSGQEANGPSRGRRSL